MRICRILVAILGALTIFCSHETFAALPCSGINLIQQDFPSTSATKQTHWNICWQMQQRYGLVITYASFTPNLQRAGAVPIQIFWDARVAEIFVPYHDGKHLFDISGGNYLWQPLNNPGACPPSSTLP